MHFMISFSLTSAHPILIMEILLINQFELCLLLIHVSVVHRPTTDNSTTEEIQHVRQCTNYCGRIILLADHTTTVPVCHKSNLE